MSYGNFNVPLVSYWYWLEAILMKPHSEFSSSWKWHSSALSWQYMKGVSYWKPTSPRRTASTLAGPQWYTDSASSWGVASIICHPPYPRSQIKWSYSKLDLHHIKLTSCIKCYLEANQVAASTHRSTRGSSSRNRSSPHRDHWVLRYRHDRSICPQWKFCLYHVQTRNLSQIGMEYLENQTTLESIQFFYVLLLWTLQFIFVSKRPYQEPCK